MSRTPSKEIILGLKAKGMTQREIAAQFGVTPASITWRLRYAPFYNAPEPEPGFFPLHVRQYWKSQGKSESWIRSRELVFSQDMANREKNLNGR